MAKKPSLFEKYSHIDFDALQKNMDDFFGSDYVEDARIPPVLGRSLKENNEILSKIGQMTVEWSEIESWIDQSIWRILDVTDNLGACITAQYIGPGPRCRALLSLCHLSGIDQEVIDDLKEFKQEAQRIGENRNRFNHDRWIEIINMKTKESKIVRNQIRPEVPHQQAQIEVAVQDAEKWVREAKLLKDIFVICIFPRLISSLLQKRVQK